MDVGDAAPRSERDTGKRSRSVGGDGFGLAVSRTAVAQLCESTGFQSVQASALDALAKVVAHYVYHVGRSAVKLANLSGRVECNVVDVIQAIGDLVAVQGFIGAADVHGCILASGVIRDISSYLSSAEEVPFAQKVLNFPISGGRKVSTSFAQGGVEASPDAHIPTWLPAFPDRSTYDRSSIENVLACKSKINQEALIRQPRRTAHSLLVLKRWMAGNGGDASISFDESNLMKEKPTGAHNPFLMPPLPFGAKEVSRLDFKGWAASQGKQVGDSQASIPAGKPVSNGVMEIEDGECRFSPSRKPVLKFRLHGSKPSLHSSSQLDQVHTCKCDTFLKVDGEKKEKKLKKDLILGESTENSLESGKLQDAM